MNCRKLMRWTGTLLLIVGVVSGLRIPFFYLRNDLVSHRLLGMASSAAANATTNRQLGQQAGAQTGSKTGLGASSRSSVGSAGVTVDPKSAMVRTIPLAQPSSGSLLGVVVIPTLNLHAPLLQGATDTELNVGVGHLSSSAAMGGPGIAELSAHNATWFRHIDTLKPGDAIEVTVAGTTYTYQVTGHEIVKTGAAIPNSAKPELVLESCYPLNALYLTSSRYLVFAQLAHASSEPATTRGHTSGSNTASGVPKVYAEVPSDLQQDGLLLHQNDLPLGTMSWEGKPDKSLVQGPLPLEVSNTMVQLYEAVLIASSQNHISDLMALVPTLTQDQLKQDDDLLSQSLNGIRYLRPLNLTIHADGSVIEQVTAEAVFQVNGQTYDVQMVAASPSAGAHAGKTATAVHGTELKLTQIRMFRKEG